MLVALMLLDCELVLRRVNGCDCADRDAERARHDLFCVEARTVLAAVAFGAQLVADLHFFERRGLAVGELDGVGRVARELDACAARRNDDGFGPLSRARLNRYLFGLGVEGRYDADEAAPTPLGALGLLLHRQLGLRVDDDGARIRERLAVSRRLAEREHAVARGDVGERNRRGLVELR